MFADRRPLVAGNWKMNGLSDALGELTAIASGVGGFEHAIETVICPPATLIASACSNLSGTPLMIGAQDCSLHVEGAFTGDISAAMLADSGARFVILGHSERRQGRGEASSDVSRKVGRSLDAGLAPIICIGETEQQMLDGATETVLREQLEESIPDAVDAASLAVAYEPVWAIGTGRIPTLSRIADLHGFIRQVLCEKLGPSGKTIRILYGGSVKPDNAADICAIADVGGALVGGASLTARDFIAISAAFAANAQGRH